MLSGNALGKKAEDTLFDYFDSLGKYVYVARLADTYDANKGRWGDPTQKKVFIPRRPCDFMLIYGGITCFCEVKATADEKGINSKLFKKQIAERTRILKAGGTYTYFIYSGFKKCWYCILAEDLKGNETWEELESCKQEEIPEVKE